MTKDFNNIQHVSDKKYINGVFFLFSLKRFSLRMVNRYGISLIPLVKLCPADMYSYLFILLVKQCQRRIHREICWQTMTNRSHYCGVCPYEKPFTLGNPFAYPGIIYVENVFSIDLTNIYVLESIFSRIQTYFSSILCLWNYTTCLRCFALTCKLKWDFE